MYNQRKGNSMLNKKDIDEKKFESSFRGYSKE